MVEYAETMLQSWRDGETRNVQQEMARLTLRVAAKALFDTDVVVAATEVRVALTEALTTLDHLVASMPVLLPGLIPSPQSIQVKRAPRRIDALVYRIIADRRQSDQDPGDLLSLLLHARDEDGSHLSAAALTSVSVRALPGPKPRCSWRRSHSGSTSIWCPTRRSCRSPPSRCARATGFPCDYTSGD